MQIKRILRVMLLLVGCIFIFNPLVSANQSSGSSSSLELSVENNEDAVIDEKTSSLMSDINGVKNAKKKLKFEENALLALNYHRVRSMNFLTNLINLISSSQELERYSVSAEEFRDQMKWLVDHDANFLTLEEVLKYKVSGEFPPRSVWINFDDMDATIYENAHPVLKEFGIPATGFVITGEVGNKDFNDIELVDQEKLKEMEASGLWEFETHTHKLHYIDKSNTSLMVKTETNQLKKDLTLSKDYLDKNLKSSSGEAIAYPYGQIDDKNIKAIEATGIKYGFTLEEEVIEPTDHDYFMPRILINQNSFDRLIKTWEGFDESK